MSRRIGVMFWFITLLLLTPAVLLAAFDLAVLDEGVHMRLYERCDSAEAAGLSAEALKETNKAIVDYLKGYIDDLTIEAEIDGVIESVFNERELSHMRDVRTLFDLSRSVRVYCLLFALCAFIPALLLSRGSKPRIFKAGAAAIGAWVLTLAAFMAYAAMDFTRAFNLFHEVLFTNDLWMLDPQTDRMIRMMPEQFFGALATRAAVFMGISLLLCLAALYGIQYISERRLK